MALKINQLPWMFFFKKNLSQFGMSLTFLNLVRVQDGV